MYFNQQIVEITAGSIFPAIYHIYHLLQVGAKSPHFGCSLTRGLTVLTLFLTLVITEGYGVRATTIKGQNASAPGLCFGKVSRSRQMVKTHVIRL